LSGINPYWELQARNGGTSANRQLGFYTNATSGDVLTLTQAGNVGIGTTNPTVKLDIEDSTSASMRLLATGVVDFMVSSIASSAEVKFSKTGTSGPITFYNGGSERIRITSSGKVGINTTPSYLFHVNGNAATSQTFYVDVGNYNNTQTLFEHTGATTPVPFKIAKSGYTGSSQAFGILSLHMNHSTTGGGSNLHFTLLDSSSTVTEYAGIGAQIVDNTDGSEDGRLNFWVTNNGSTRQNKMYLDNTGNLSISGTLTESSALRYKENVHDLEYNNLISQLKPKIYNKIGEEKQEVGLIAEDVEVLDKTLVTYNDDGQVEGIQYTRLVPHLIAHIQKLEERIARMENGESSGS